jgi:amino acid transporter
MIMIVRVFQSKSLWLKLLSIVIFIVSAFFCFLNLLVAPEYIRQAIDKFDGQDGYVYLAQEFFGPGLGVDYPYCLSFRQYQRIAPGVLVYRKSFAPKINKLDKYLSSYYGAGKCSDSRDMVKESIEQIRQRFRAKSSN